MNPGRPLVGRVREYAVLTAHARAARDGRGSVVLLSGEAGSGKTALARAVLDTAGLDSVKGVGAPGGVAAFGPIVEVLRGLARARPGCLEQPVPLRAALAALLPEIGAGTGPGDISQLGAAISAALAGAAGAAPLAVVLDNMQWIDEATAGLLPELARALASTGILLLIVYRHEEISSEHPIRRLRAQLRQDQRITEVTLAPLDRSEMAELLEQELGHPPAAALVNAVEERAGGVPFFVVELAVALARQTGPGPASAGENDVAPLPLPENVRDAVLLRADGLADESRRLLDVAAVTGLAFAAEGAMAVARTDSWPTELIDRGILVEAPDGELAFRHALVRDSFLGEIPPPRRRRLHAEVAHRLEADGAPAALVAEHWLEADVPAAARRSFLAAVEAHVGVHAYRDGARAARHAVELAGEDADARLEALELLARCASLDGDAAAAGRAWREVAVGRADGDLFRCAEAWRQCAGQLEIQGRWEEALAAREEAAVAFGLAGAPEEAGVERLAAATHLRSAASFRAALRVLEPAARDAAASDGPELGLRVRALEGNVRARMGDYERGLALVREALADALQNDLGSVAAEAYQRLADALEHGGDYSAARGTYDEAATFCSTIGADPLAEVCLACLSVVLRQTGDWTRACSVAADVIASPGSTAHARSAAGCTLGLIQALRGDVVAARALLLEIRELARTIELTAAEILCAWGLAVLAQSDEHPGAQVEACRAITTRWQEVEDRHYSIAPLRWATSRLCELGDSEGARACAAALARIAADTGQREAMSALAHALGEMALLDGEDERAAEQFQHAVDLLKELGAPFERMESDRRAAVALVRCGRREEAVTRLFDAYRLARRMRARPSVQRLAAALDELGERGDRRLSRRQAEQLASAQLTRRELEVVRSLALGQTNREIAAALFLSVRTVDAHVSHILQKLDCRSRAEATRRAVELGLTAADPQ